MLEREELVRIYSESIENLGDREYRAWCAVKARGVPYYGILGKDYPNHLSSFKGMRARTDASGLPCDFEHSANGFIDFLVYLGDIPEGMGRPSIGRLDHSKGYVRGNFRWESFSENSAESGRRRKHKKGEEASKAKLTNGEVTAIRAFRDALVAEGWSLRKVGRAVKGALEANGMTASASNIYYILSERTFKEV
jgi:hypothetical protein